MKPVHLGRFEARIFFRMNALLHVKHKLCFSLNALLPFNFYGEDESQTFC